MDTEENSAPAPAWMQALENKRKRVHRLAHEIGAGSPCLTCGEGCPGLDLHFWRKLCRNCKCKKEDHDVIDDYGYEQFELLLGASHTKPKRGRAFLNIRETESGKVEEEQPPAKKVAFDWIPPDVSADLAAEYMAALPTGKLPISGSDGALYRRQQLERQLPLHDLDAEQCHQLTPAEVDRLKEYLENLRENVVGQGRIAKLPMHTSHSADSLRLPSVYNSVPKPFHANQAGKDNPSSGEGDLRPPSTLKIAPGLSLKPPSAFLPKDRISPIPRDTGRSSSPNYASEAPSSIVKNPVPSDIARSSVADRSNVFGVTLTPPRSRSNAQLSPTRSASGLSRDASPSYLDRNLPTQKNLLHSTALPNPQNTHPFSSPGVDSKSTPSLKPKPYQSPINSRDSSPSHYDRNPAPQIGLAHSSSLSPKQRAQVGGGSKAVSPSYKNAAPHVGSADTVLLPHQSPVNSRDPSPSYLDRNRAPLTNLAHSMSLPGVQNTSVYSSRDDGTLYPGSHRGIDSALEYVRQPPQDTTKSWSVPGQYHIPVSQGFDDSAPSSLEYVRQPPQDSTTSRSVPGQYHIPVPQALDKSTPSIQEYVRQPPQDITSSWSVPGQYHNHVSSSPRAISPRYDPAMDDLTNPEMFGKTCGEPTSLFNQKPIGGRVLRDHVPKLYASEATPPGGLWVPVDYLEGPKSKPVDGKLLREPVYGCLATSTIVPEALKVLPPSTVEEMSCLRADDSANSGRYQDRSDHPQLKPSDKTLEQPSTQNLIQSKSAPHSDAMYARITAHSPSEFELDPQDTLSPQVAALSIDIPTEDYPPLAKSEPVDPAVDSTPLTLLSCVHCQETVLPGEVVVCADRAGPDFVWHPKCFVCDTCGELLVDLVYFYSKGRVFCGRHFANLLDIPRCKACDELIFVREYTVAEGEVFHVKHFCCFECDIPLADKQYIPHEGHPVCLDCFEKKYGKKCHTCGLAIDAGKQRMSLKDLHWHLDPNCFKCFKCHKSLIGGRLLLNQEQPFCSKECVMLVHEATI